MRVGVDVDGVLADQMGAVLRILNALHEERYTVEQVTGWGAPMQLYHISESDLLRHMEEAWAHRDVGWLVDSHEVWLLMRRLGRYSHTFHILSKRTPKSWPYVLPWLCAPQLPLASISFLTEGSKFSYPIDILIDDNPKCAQEAPRWKKQLILVDQPWNQHVEEGSWVHRVSSVLEGLDWLLEKEVCDDDPSWGGPQV
ncbi:MAG TPA: 5' nucleotidase, NT5C type [Candidatus Tripitaka californicus]|uniref:5' nucleotidase, NT5C type n=1 Tax=Candidatus Tripitaka californicus TaxID=3367616 RepID=UPI004026550F